MSNNNEDSGQKSRGERLASQKSDNVISSCCQPARSEVTCLLAMLPDYSRVNFPEGMGSFSVH